MWLWYAFVWWLANNFFLLFISDTHLMLISVTQSISFFHLPTELFYFLLFSLLSGEELATASILATVSSPNQLLPLLYREGFSLHEILFISAVLTSKWRVPHSESSCLHLFLEAFFLLYSLSFIVSGLTLSRHLGLVKKKRSLQYYKHSME